MAHAKVDTTLNVYTQVIDGALRTAVDQVGSELFTIVHKPERGDGANALKGLAHHPGRFPQLVNLGLRPAKRHENRCVRIAPSGEIEVSQWSRRGRATV